MAEAAGGRRRLLKMAWPGVVPDRATCRIGRDQRRRGGEHCAGSGNGSRTGDHEIPPCSSESLRRSPHGHQALRHRYRHDRPGRRGDQRGDPTRRSGLSGHRRRQHLPRADGGGKRHGACLGRLYGHAGHGDERAGDAVRAGKAGARCPGDVGHFHRSGLRELRAPQGHAASGTRPGGDFRRRHGQPVLHHGHGGRPARRRDRLRCAVQRHQGRWGLFGRPGENPGRGAL